MYIDILPIHKSEVSGTQSMGPPFAIVNFGSSFLLLSFLVVHQKVLSDLISKPVNSESLVNESTYFNCSSSITAKEIDWHHYPIGAEAHQGKTVYAFGKFYTGYQEDFVLEKNSSSGVYNLVIKSVKPSYAGRYECRDSGGHSYSAQLIVLDGEPECNSDINPYGVIGPNACGIQPDELHLSCSISYHGNIPPDLTWHRLGENDPISENVTKSQSANRFTYNLTVKADQLRDKSSFECRTTNSRTSKHSCTSETVKLLYIFSASSVSIKSIGEVVNCSANTSSQSCQYKWKWYNKEDSLTVSNNRILEVENIGMYRCEATCNIRDKQCIVNASLVNATQNSSVNGSVTIDSGVSSATPVWVPIVVIIICVLVILLVLFIILRWKHGNRGTFCGLCKILKAEERPLEEAFPINEVPMQDASPLLQDYRIAGEPYQEKETTAKAEEKKVKDGTNPVTENSNEEAHPLLQIPAKAEEKKVKDGTNPVTENSTEEADPLLQIPGTTADNPIILDNEQDKDGSASPEEGHPGKRKKTEAPKNEEIMDYSLNPTFLHAESLSSAEDKKISISGLTVLDKELFITFEKMSEVKVFQAIAFSPVRSIEVMDLDNPLDMVSSPVNSCLYISSLSKIYRVDASGKIIAKWPIEGGGTLSVTHDQTIVLSDRKRTALIEYSAYGQSICEVKLPSGVHPFHAVKISVDQFVVSYEHGMVHKVAIFDIKGTNIQSFSGMLKFPYLVVNSDGFIFVADRNNSRVLMINPTLKSSKVILSDKDTLGRPSRICLDEENSRMFVADNKADNIRFMVFRLQKHKAGANEDIAVNQAKPLGSNQNLKEDLGATEDTAVNQDKPIDSNHDHKEESGGMKDKSVVISDISDNEEEVFVDAEDNIEQSRGEKRKR